MSNPNIESIYRLSPLQQGILFHTLGSTGGEIYFEQYMCDYRGALDTEVLRQAWENTAQRHPVLRTLFTWEKRDQPLQIVRKTVTLPWRNLDWRDHGANEQDAEWTSLVEQDRQLGFDLEQTPLFRLALVRLTDESWRLLWSFHHILLDGWSMRLIMAEVNQAYSAMLRGETPDLERPPGYSTFIAWLERQDSASIEAFWRDYLQGYETPSKLALPRSLNGAGTAGAKNRETVVARLDSDTMARLRAFVQSQRITLNTLFVGAWSLVVARFSQRGDVVFGTTVAGRSMELDGVEQIAGLLINTLPMRVKLSPDRDIGEWLREIQSAQSRMLRFEQSSLVDIQHWSDLPPGTPLFDIILVFENFATDAGDAPEMLVAENEQYIEYSNYPLAVLVVPGLELEIIVVHDPALYDNDTVARLLEHLQDALLRLIDKEAETLSTLMTGPVGERSKILDYWNRTAAPYPDDRCIHDLIEDNVNRTPEAIAVAHEDRSISYRELGDRSNQLANYLIERGLRRGQLVPVLFERTLEAIVAIVGVLKAGGAYVPLDPELPQARLVGVLDDLELASRGKVDESGGMLFLSQSTLQDKIPFPGLQRLFIDEDWDKISQADAIAPDAPLSPVDLAYVIYTSGSTGQPKGVTISHRNLVNSTAARPAYYGDGLTAFLLMSSLATDSSVAGLFWALTTGAKLVLPRRRQEQDIDGLVGLIRGQQVSHMLCLPSLHAAFIELGAHNALASLSALIVAGEACTTQVIERHIALLPDTALYNEYGPTEGTVWATVARLDKSQQPGLPHIGKPISNATVYILNPDLQPVPIGVPGELYIGGLGVAGGYLNRPKQTAEKFIANPFRDTPDPVLYRTGDLTRFRADGNLEFLGRIDQQVKLRGYRVELEEIEQRLSMHPEVNEAAVVLEEDLLALRDGLLSLGIEQAESLLTEIEGLPSAASEQVSGVQS